MRRLASLAASVLVAACGPTAPTPEPPVAPVGLVVEVAAEGIAFDPTTLRAPAGTAFAIAFTNRDRSVPHDVDVRRTDGAVVADNPPLRDAGETTYVIGALERGSYVFICSLHPVPAMTGTLSVE